jgi:GH25 family lysozyme M1 (1,4-beta-N-acetylmuramidase)
MWYTRAPDEIATMAKKWIDRVEKATGLPVVIYTNPSWWNAVMQKAGMELATKHAIWTSRYTGKGPAYEASWTAQGGNPKFGMPPLPKAATYSATGYDVGHFWQYSESGRLPDSVFTCLGTAVNKQVDMDWIPVATPEFEKLFKVSN